MNQTVSIASPSAAEQLRPIVLTVVAAKIAVFALLMTTVNIQSPVMPEPVQLAALR